MVPNHAIQTDPYLHEPKGISTAAAGTVYVATGAGTGTWTTTGTNSAFSNTTNTGLLFTVSGGYMRSLAYMALISGVSLTLTDATTNYVYVDLLTGTILSNTTGFLPKHVPLFTVVTASGSVNSVTDLRGSVVNSQPSGYLAITMTDADRTLLESEWGNSTIKITGTLTGAKNVIVPANQPSTFFINGTGQTLTFKTAAGTGIAVATNKTACVRADGTNVIRLTADV